MDAESEQARRQLQQILTDPEFGQQLNMEQIVGDNWIQELLPNSEGVPAIAEWFVYILAGLLILGVLGGIVFYWRKRKKRSIATEGTLETISKQEELLAEIKEFANKGHYQTAIQKCFLFLLQKLADQEKLHFAKTKTNGEYRSILTQNRPEMASEFIQLSEQFDRVWYGEQKVGLQDYLTYQRQVFAFLGKEAHDEKS